MYNILDTMYGLVYTMYSKGYIKTQEKIMSTAQKRVWFEMMLSLAGLGFCGLSYFMFNLAGEHFYSPPWRYYIPLVNLLNALCLAGFVLVAAKYKAKNFDERELAISHKAQICGFIGVFVYLVLIAMVFFVQNILAVMPIRMILLLIVSSFFFSTLVTAISFLFMYPSRIENKLN
jgi:hypothetical protein